MNRLKEQTTQLKKLTTELHIFLGIRQINSEVHKCSTSDSKHNITDKYDVNFEIQSTVKSVLTEVQTFGKINIDVTKLNPPLSQAKVGQAQMHAHPVTKNVSEVRVKIKRQFSIKKESEKMFVTGCSILTNGQLLIGDYCGKEQLIQYNQDGTHVRDIPVSSKPYDVTVIDSDRVAVSYGTSCNIEILNIQKTRVDKKFHLKNNTYGLSYQGGKLYVLVDFRGIVVIELSGKIVNTLEINIDSMHYLTTTTDRIYYSNYHRNTVTCCDMTGRHIWEFRDYSVQHPFGLIVDNNQNVFVVGWSTHNVTLVSRDGKTSKTLLTESDGLYGPRAIHFNKITKDLLVCNLD